MGGEVFGGLQAALLESSALALAEQRAAAGWPPHHAPDYAHGHPASVYYEVPLGHPDAADPAPAGPHRRPHPTAGTQPVHHGGASVRSSGHGTIDSRASITGRSQAGWSSPPTHPVPPVVHVDSRDYGTGGTSSTPSVAGTTVSSSTRPTSSTGGRPLPSISEATVAPPPALTATDISRIVVETLAASASAAPSPAAATATKVPAPHSSFKFPIFDGTEDKYVAFSRSVTQSLEMPCFDPGSDALVTTDANKTQSAQLRNCLYAALTKVAVARFDDRDDLKFKGFEMIAILREAYAPTGDDY